MTLGFPRSSESRGRAGIPENVSFQTKPQIALDQLRVLAQSDVPRAVVLADAGYGNDTGIREGIQKLKLSSGGLWL